MLQKIINSKIFLIKLHPISFCYAPGVGPLKTTSTIMNPAIIINV
ncbi:hypothetical protein FED53_05545 [Priestia flexa]|nr:hypothetical protein FED53_05545 [Priestia flexa]RIV15626.1 hypothetical protein D1859_00230 [Priestia flexa]